jgi:hypothetical protein
MGWSGQRLRPLASAVARSFVLNTDAGPSSACAGPGQPPALSLAVVWPVTPAAFPADFQYRHATARFPGGAVSIQHAF